MADNEKLGDKDGQKTEKSMHHLHMNRIGEQKAIFKTKYRMEESELPEPPPDPWANSWHTRNSQTLLDITQIRNLDEDEDEDIFSYLTGLGAPPFQGQTSECPSRNSVTSTMAISNIYADDVFEHLGRLYTFTEQILELRNRNTKFFKRVRNLERLKVLQIANQKLENAFVHDKDAAIDICDEDTGFAESLLDAMLSNCRDPPFQKRNVRSSSSRQAKNKLDADKQSSTYGISGSVPKVSKWTRVKAAFKWERACTNDTEVTDPTVITPATTSTISLSVTPTNCYRTTDSEIEESKCIASSSCINEAYDQGTSLDQTSFTSLSNAGFYDCSRQNVVNNFQSQSPKSETGKRRENKSCPNESVDNDSVTLDTDQVKNAELTNEINHRKPLIRITSEKNRMAYSASKMDGRGIELRSKTLTPTLTIGIPSREEDIKCTSSPESPSPLFCHANISDGHFSQHRKMYQELLANKDFKRQQSCGEESSIRTSKMQGQDSKWNQVRRAFLTNSTLSDPSNIINFAPKQMLLQHEIEASENCNYNDSVENIEKMTRLSTRADTQRGYQTLREKLGTDFHRKLTEWERLKNMPTLTVAKDNREISSNFLCPRESLLSEERLTPDFKKKLQDWKRVKKIRRGSAPFEQRRISRRRLTDWQLWRSPSKSENRNKEVIGSRTKGETGDIVNDAKSHLCEDFVRKMEAWRKTNETSTQDIKNSLRSKSHGLGISVNIDESEFIALERLLSLFDSSMKKGRRECDVQQLDECFDCDTRLYTDGTQNENITNEVLVRTSVGSYRFEGISREFTRKLYDWEKYRGISPTSSTFRLLGPAYTLFQRETTIETSTANPAITNVDGDVPVSIKVSTLKRSQSVGNVNERSTENEFFLRRSGSLQSLDFAINNRFTFIDRDSNLAASIDPQTTGGIPGDIMDDSEPEAMIVDIEDVIEETASPLERVQPRQTPVYSVAASETTSIAVPLGTVTSSHEPSPMFLIEMENGANEDYWPPKICNQRKSFSSEDSSSIEHFEMSNLESEHWPIANSSNKKIYNIHDSTDHLHPDSDKNSVKSNDSICSMELASKHKAVTWSMVMAKKTNATILREIRPVVSVDDENPIEAIGKEDSSAARCRHNQDLPGEKKLDEEGPNQVEENSRSSSNEKDVADITIKCDNEYEEVIVNRSDPHSCTLTNIHSAESRNEANANISPQISTICQSDKVDAIFDEGFSYTNRSVKRSKEPEDNYGIIRDEVHDVCSDTSKLKLDRSNCDQSKTYPQYWDREKESHYLKETVASVRSVERAELQEPHNVENVSTFVMLRATNSCTRENHREPTIRTTAYTVAPCREERYFERIIINEDTLNKIVVPTANAGCIENIQAPKDAAGCSITEDSPEKHQHRSSVGRDTPINRDASSKKQTTSSPSRNVFIKTKRIIFAPFRRSEERSSGKKENNTLENNHLLTTKGQSKSRSVSPKISRQDPLLRVSLSLPWPLRSSSKDRETIETGVERGDKGKQVLLIGTQNLEQCKSMKDSEKNISQTRMKGETPFLQDRHSSFELTTKKNEFRYSIKQRNQSASVSSQVSSNEQQNQSSLGISLPSLKCEDEVNEMASFSKLDPSSSDLIYKLNILSNVVAKRDGRTNTISEDSPVETHSLRIRRAKEDFLSRRGGPLCHSVLDPPSTKDESFRRVAPHFYEEIFEDREEISTQRTRSPNEISSTAEISNNCDARQVAKTKEKKVNHVINECNVNDISNNSTVSRADRIKSASAGMINVDPDTFVRLTESNRGCESLPRSISKQRQSVGPLAKIVGRLKFARLIRSKDTEEEKSTISKLCRQSLLIDVRNDFERWEAGDRGKILQVGKLLAIYEPDVKLAGSSNPSQWAVVFLVASTRMDHTFYLRLLSGSIGGSTHQT